MPSVRPLIPQGVGPGEGFINVVTSNPITIVAWGFNGGEDVVNVALKYQSTPPNQNDLYVDCWRDGQRVQVKATNNPVTVYGPGFFRIYKDSTEAVGAVAVADTNAWYHVFYVDGASTADFDTAGAVTVNDSSGNPVKGNVAAAAVANRINFAYSYDTNTQAGLSAGTDKDCVVLVEGDGGAGQAISYFTITRTAVVPVSCVPPADNNA
jgi:hypothetical protein